MKWKNINVPLGVSETPIGTTRLKSGDAAVGLFGGFMGSVLDYISQHETNTINDTYNRSSLYQNQRQFNDQMAYARASAAADKIENRFLVNQAYERELENREYNSPRNEMKRLREAGLNPYLAKYGNGAVGGSGSIGAQVGSPGKSFMPGNPGVPSNIPNQAFTGFGRGITDALGLVLQNKELAQKERVFEHDVAVQENQMEMNWFDYLDRHAKSGAEVREINERIDNMRKVFAFEQDKFEKQIEWQNFQQYVQQYQLEQRDFELGLQQIATESGIQVNSAMSSKLFAEKKNFEESARQMVKNGFSQRQLNSALERKENAIADSMVQEYEQDHGQLSFENRNKVLKAYKRVANAILQPIRGIVSAGANVATKVK